MAIRVLGLEQLGEDFRRLAAFATTAEVRTAFRRGAALIRDEARRQAPRGKAAEGSKTPGLLRRSIISFLGRRRLPNVAAFARVNILKGRSKAPHGHLVEFGTKIRRPVRKKFMTIRGRHIRRVKQVRGVNANPYFARAVVIAGPRAADSITATIKRFIEARAKSSS